MAKANGTHVSITLKGRDMQRGFPTEITLGPHEIADALSFRSVQADSENVRELVHRVRRKLASVSADDLIESKRGVGYRLRAAGRPAPPPGGYAPARQTLPPSSRGRAAWDGRGLVWRRPAVAMIMPGVQ